MPPGLRQKDDLCRCCDDDFIKADFMALDRGVIPDGWAVVSYALDGQEPPRATFENMYSSRQSPPMLDFFGNGNLVVSQDKVETFLFIEASTNTPTQRALPFVQDPKGAPFMDRRFAGVGVVANPSRSQVFLAMLAHNACFLQILESQETCVHHFPYMAGPHNQGQRSGLRFIHFAFGDEDDCRIYVLASSILEPSSQGGNVCDAVVILKFADSRFSQITEARVVPLPKEQCKAHRVQHCEVVGHKMLFISEFTESLVLQIRDPQLVALLPVTVSSSTKRLEGANEIAYDLVVDEHAQNCAARIDLPLSPPNLGSARDKKDKKAKKEKKVGKEKKVAKKKKDG